MKAVQEFQEEVLSAIAEVQPHVRDRIIQRLNERRALRRTVSIIDQRFSMNDVSKSFHECVKLIILDNGPLTLK